MCAIMRYFEPLNVLDLSELIQSSRSKHSNTTLIEAMWILAGSDSQVDGEQKLRTRRVQINWQSKPANARLSGGPATNTNKQNVWYKFRQSIAQ